MILLSFLRKVYPPGHKDKERTRPRVLGLRVPEREMASTPTRNEEKKGSRMSPAAAPSGGSLKVSLSRSEEFLTRISTELTNEALFIAGCPTNSVPTKEKQTQDRGTQISKHVFFKTRGTDTRTCIRAARSQVTNASVCWGLLVMNSSTLKASQVFWSHLTPSHPQLARTSPETKGFNKKTERGPSLFPTQAGLWSGFSGGEDVRGRPFFFLLFLLFFFPCQMCGHMGEMA
ncbi:uncharacterized protein LOC122895573 isoform X1 [Neovison vison]|uniref:uncharacterized protein LOC122895573 isoform X1 n=2 Tax=Neovison vison TaxID=452646 RepID=UPI001CF0C72F|nr:uncharacterized protein LOC122895573 isoform X1 [Neogale vison]